MVGFRPALDRLRDVLGLVVLAAVLSTLVSATVGVTSAWLGGLIPAATFGKAWRTWWLGDAMGDLVVAPLLFVWSGRGRFSRPRLWIAEAGAVCMTVGALSLLVFGGMAPNLIDSPYILFPALIWAAVRLGPQGAISAMALVSAIAVGGTVSGLGPFAGQSLHESLLALQAFLSIVAVTTLVLAAVVAERQQAEAQLTASLREKEVLLKEVHHRVKNNLQIVSSLLELQSDVLDDATLLAQFRESQDRIRSMALIHETLYQSQDLARLDLALYIHTLSARLVQSYNVDPQRITVHLQVEPVILDIDQAIPCGLILNELLSNAFKYAFPENRTGEVRIALHADTAQQAGLVVRDNGIGFPDEIEVRHTESLGLQLVVMLTEQLQGTIALERADWTTFTLTFPVRHVEA
jgi:two-component sensor histidine kinase